MTAPDGSRPSSLGGTIGGRIAQLVADAGAFRVAKTQPAIARTINTVIDQWMRILDAEARAAMGPLLGPLNGGGQEIPDIAPIMRAITHPSGQWQAWLAQTVGGQVASGGLIPLIDNYFTPFTADIIARQPNLMIGVGDLVDGLARNKVDVAFARREAARQGINSSRLGQWANLRIREVDPSAALELWRRGDMSDGAFRQRIRDAGLSEEAVRELKLLAPRLLTPEQLAEMWNRSIVTTDEGRRVAAQSGLEPSDFDKLTELGGVPLAPQDLGEAFRRGFIDRGRFNRGIVQGPIRNEWFDVLERLQFKRMSPQNAAQAVLQGKMSLSEGQRVAHENGLDPNDFATIVESTGQPPGISLMQEAWNRGIINEREFTEAFLEGNLKNRWIDVLKATRFRVLPREQINLSYRHGGFNRQQALERYRWNGFDPEASQAMLVAEDARRLGPERDLSIATVRELYEARAIERRDAIDFYKTMGFDDESTALLLAIADIRAARRRQNLAVSRVRSRFISFRIDSSAASVALDQLQLLPAERDDLIATWTIEREVSIPRLTTSQIQQALKKGLIDAQGALTRLQQNGYTVDDATILVRIAGGTLAEEG